MTNNFGLIGFPLGHSMSPFIHSRLFKLSGIAGEYKLYPTTESDLKTSIDFLKTLKGFNITIPHKKSFLPFIKRLHSSAEFYGSVNTVSVKDGEFTGYNTDVDGFSSALDLANIPLKGKVLVCGAGGVAGPIAKKALVSGCSVDLAVRNPFSKNVCALKNEIKKSFKKEINVITFENVSSSYDLAINGTPLGMYPNIGYSPLNENQLKNISFVFDTVFNPAKTELIKKCDKLGITSVGGMSMLVMQAAKAHKYWYGADFNPQDMLLLTEETYFEMERLFK